MSDEGPEQGTTGDAPRREAEESDRRPPRLRRGLLGYRASDVRAEIESRETEVEKLGDEIAALWLAFARQERTIRHLIAAVEALGEASATAPSVSPAPGETPATTAVAPRESGPEPDDTIGAQLDDLGEVLAAIERATRTLERTYADELEEAPTEAGEEGEDPDPDAGGEPGSGR